MPTIALFIRPKRVRLLHLYSRKCSVRHSFGVSRHLELSWVWQEEVDTPHYMIQCLTRILRNCKTDKIHETKFACIRNFGDSPSPLAKEEYRVTSIGRHVTRKRFAFVERTSNYTCVYVRRPLRRLRRVAHLGAFHQFTVILRLCIL